MPPVPCPGFHYPASFGRHSSSVSLKLNRWSAPSAGPPCASSVSSRERPRAQSARPSFELDCGETHPHERLHAPKDSPSLEWPNPRWTTATSRIVTSGSDHQGVPGFARFYCASCRLPQLSPPSAPPTRFAPPTVHPHIDFPTPFYTYSC